MKMILFRNFQFFPCFKLCVCVSLCPTPTSFQSHFHRWALRQSFFFHSHREQVRQSERKLIYKSSVDVYKVVIFDSVISFYCFLSRSLQLLRANYSKNAYSRYFFAPHNLFFTFVVFFHPQHHRIFNHFQNSGRKNGVRKNSKRK